MKPRTTTTWVLLDGRRVVLPYGSMVGDMPKHAPGNHWRDAAPLGAGYAVWIEKAGGRREMNTPTETVRAARDAAAGAQP